MNITINNEQAITDALQKSYFAILCDEKGLPQAIIEPGGNVLDQNVKITMSTKSVGNINGIQTINVLCKPGQSPCCVHYDDAYWCWC